MVSNWPIRLDNLPEGREAVMKITQLSLSVLCLLIGVNTYANTSQNTYFKEERTKEVSRSKVYTATLHSRFSFGDDYEEGGRFYYSDNIDSFGNQEVLDTETEMIFCGPGDRSFTDTIINAAANNRTAGYNTAGREFGVSHDSTTVGFSPSQFENEISNTLLNNADTPQTKGRFCYDESNANGRISYRQAGAESAVYCNPLDFSEASFVDPVSGQTCKLKLDIPIKVGSKRLVRQLQGDSSITIGEGYLGCYASEITGDPLLRLHSNSEECASGNYAECSLTCDWAENLVCNPNDMPAWGSCRGVGTLLFKNDSIVVKSVDALSFNTDEGVVYEGEATFSCRVGPSGPYWSVSNPVCSPAN